MMAGEYARIPHIYIWLPYCNPGQEWLKYIILISFEEHTRPTYTVTRDTSMFLKRNQNYVF